MPDPINPIDFFQAGLAAAPTDHFGPANNPCVPDFFRDAYVGNCSPTASFTVVTDDVTATFDASASSAMTPGGIASYEWDFGDGATGTGVAPTHTYAGTGSYLVMLTVVDQYGFRGSTSRQVEVFLAGVLCDADYTNGWGEVVPNEHTGNWSYDAQTSQFRIYSPDLSSEEPSQALIYGWVGTEQHNAESLDTEILARVWMDSADLTLQRGWIIGVRAKSPSRRGYRLRYNVSSTGARLALWGKGNELVAVTPASPAFKTWYWMRLKVAGIGTDTLLQGRVWPDGDVEPTTWQLSRTGSQIALAERIDEAGFAGLGNGGGGGTAVSKPTEYVFTQVEINCP